MSRDLFGELARWADRPDPLSGASTLAEFRHSLRGQPDHRVAEVEATLPAETTGPWWEALAGSCRRVNELERTGEIVFCTTLDALRGYPSSPARPPRVTRRTPHHGTATSTSTGSQHVQLSNGDLLKQIPASQYLPAFTGEVVSSAGRTRCPSPDHPDEHPACKCYGTRFVCFACGARGTIIDAASLVSGIEPSGASYFELRRWIIETLGLGTRP